MKKNKKEKLLIPVVHVMGDLQDVKMLVKLVNKKKTLVIFRNGEDATLYAEVEGDMMQFGEADIVRLKSKYRLVYFDFFPGKKGSEIQIKDEMTVKTPSPGDDPAANGKKEKTKEAKEKKEKKGKKGKKEKKVKQDADQS